MEAFPRFSSMDVPSLDFSHLTPAERIELAEQPWDSIRPRERPVRYGSPVVMA